MGILQSEKSSPAQTASPRRPPPPSPLRRLARIACCAALLCLGLWQHRSLFAAPAPALAERGGVSWDGRSLFIDDERIFLWSGEFHTWRLPVPDLWRDVLQKLKAAHFNAVSIYTHWGMIEPARGTFDWDGYRSLAPFFEMCQEEGLYVVVRPGPYINAETAGGGLPGWVTTLDAPLRGNASIWRDAWVPYIQQVAEQVKPYEHAVGGPIIAIQVENEHEQRPETAEYVADLERVLREAGVQSPLTINDVRQDDNFARGVGRPDIYGFDQYPFGFDCAHPDQWKQTPTGLADFHDKVTPQHPLYIPEMQAGSFDGWGPGSPGYSKCNTLTGAAFTQVFDLAIWAENAKMINLYTPFGGTSWGLLPFPGVYTSYDYGAAITEARLLTDKYAEIKAQGLFLRSAPDFASTHIVGNSSTHAVSVDNDDVFVTLLRGDRGTGYYVVRQFDARSTMTQRFSFNVTTSLGDVRVPPRGSLGLHGRQARLLVTDLPFGRLSSILYATAPILWAGEVAGRDLVIFRIDGEIPTIAARGPRGCLAQLDDAEGLDTDGSWRPFAGQQVMLLDDAQLATFWNPLTSSKPSENVNILVFGPYLVRKAALHPAHYLDLLGDVDRDTVVRVIGPHGLETITWNGRPVAFEASPTGDYFFSLSGPPPLRLPQLAGWRYHDGMPELESGFDDSHWLLANRTTTAKPYKMHFGDRVLFACDYGFCEGATLWRGHFISTGKETGVNLTLAGGRAFAGTVWLNETWLGSAYGNSSNDRNLIASTNQLYRFPKAPSKGDHAVVTVLVDNMGQEMEYDRYTDSIRSPRGILGYDLVNGTFTEWRVQGKLGGGASYPDRVRGIFNEGGLAGERAGWHLPGFDDSAWSERSPSKGFKHAGVGVFRTTFELDLLEGLDVPMAVRFSDETALYRVQIFVNGWNMGKRVSYLGPQAVFPVPEGILDYHGTNTIVLFVWAPDGHGTSIRSVSLEALKVLKGGVGRPQLANPGWSEREKAS